MVKLVNLVSTPAESDGEITQVDETQKMEEGAATHK